MTIEYTNRIIKLFSPSSNSIEEGEFIETHKIDNLSCLIVYGNSNINVYYTECTINNLSFNDIDELMLYLNTFVN